MAPARLGPGALQLPLLLGLLTVALLLDGEAQELLRGVTELAGLEEQRPRQGEQPWRPAALGNTTAALNGSDGSAPTVSAADPRLTGGATLPSAAAQSSLLAGFAAALVLGELATGGAARAIHVTCPAALAALALAAPLGFLRERPLPELWLAGGQASPGVALAGAAAWAFGLLVAPVGASLAFSALHLALHRSLSLSHVELWPALRQLDPASTEFREVAHYFAASCEPWVHKYGDLRLGVAGIHRKVDSAGAAQSLRRSSSRLGGARRLFHGTSRAAARSIVLEGFRLPRAPGMFGRGIYFADCPLKSWGYCGGPSPAGCEVPCLRLPGLMLLCSVELGEQMLARRANTTLKGYNRGGWWAWLTGWRGAYDSVCGATHEQGGALRVPEYVVYRPEQARVEYVLEVVRQ